MEQKGMNEREALLTGAILGTLRSLLEQSPFTYQSIRHADPVVDRLGNYENKLLVAAEDGAVFTVTIEQISGT